MNLKYREVDGEKQKVIVDAEEIVIRLKDGTEFELTEGMFDGMRIRKWRKTNLTIAVYIKNLNIIEIT